jgi:uncharacterized repeat protein (TIGR03803 family)
MTNVKNIGIVIAFMVAALAQAQTVTEVVLHDFNGTAGNYPNAGVVRDSAGALYGTTVSGGANLQGVIYKLDSAGNYEILHTFSGESDGGYPYAGVIRDAAGNLYGTTTYGGIEPRTSGYGVVYKVTKSGKYSVLHTFRSGNNGSNPFAGVIRDSAGNLYGTTDVGGKSDRGVVYSISSAGEYAVLYRFQGGKDGENPLAGLVRDAAGNLYGTTLYGGASNAGVVYRLDTVGNETVLYSFTGGADGGNPVNGVTLDSSGNLYGTTSVGGADNSGVIFKLDTSGNFSLLYSFTGGADGGAPSAGVTQGASGNLYGTTSAGGANQAGVVYMVDPSGNYRVVYTFTGGADGRYPLDRLTRGPEGVLYGTAQYGGQFSDGVIFEIKTK